MLGFYHECGVRCKIEDHALLDTDKTHRHNKTVNPERDNLSGGPDAYGSPLTLLAEALSESEDRIDLGFASLAISAAHYPLLDLAAHLRLLDSMASEVRSRIGQNRMPEAIIGALNSYLFEELGFQGNAEDFYNPSNSFINEVLSLRSGLPITLSVLYLAIGQRLELPLFGVAMPLHFLVKYHAEDKEIFIDPFHGGQVLTSAGCRVLLEKIVGKPVAFQPAYLETAPKRAILYRLLNNLKHAYLRRNEPIRAGRVVEQMLVVAPGSYSDVRDRGQLYLNENALSKGITWLTRYLDLAPDAADGNAIRQTIADAERRRASLN